MRLNPPYKYRIPGVYVMSCGPCFYVGSSRYTQQRRRDHLFALRRGTHHSPRFQDAFNTIGEAGFTFRVVDQLMEEEIPLLMQREQAYLTVVAKDPYCCNVNAAVITPVAKRIHVRSGMKPLVLIGPEGEMRFECLADAAKHLGVSNSSLAGWCKGQSPWPVEGQRWLHKSHAHVTGYSFRWA